MARYILIFVCMVSFFPASGFAQSIAPHIEWAKCFGGTDEDQAICIEQTSDKGFIIAGESYSVNGDITNHHDTSVENISSDFWIVKIDSLGTLDWQKSLGGDSNDVANSIKQTADGGYIIAGSTNSINGDVIVNHGRMDYWIVKLDAKGKIVWQKTFGGSEDEEARSIEITSDGGYIAAGYSYSIDGDISKRDSTGLPDYWVVKMDKDGNLQWEKSYGGSLRDNAESIHQSKDHGYFVAGYSESKDGDVTGNHGGDDYWVVKLDSAGNLKWQKSYGGSSDDLTYSSDLTNDGGLIVAGYSDSPDGDVIGNHGNVDFWVIRIDSAGKLLWQKSLGGSDGDAATSVKQTFDGGFVIFGYTSSYDGEVTGNHGDGSNDYWVVKLDSLGNFVWQKTLGGRSEEYSNDICLTTDGGIAAAGSTVSNDGDVSGYHGGAEDYWIVKLGYKGQNDVASSRNSFVSTSFNYPNPFSDKTTIVFSHPISSTSTLLLYNLLGVQMQKIIVPAGSVSVLLDRKGLSSGVYVYRVMDAETMIASGNIIVK